MNRRTKILATLGPSTDEPGVLKGILRCRSKCCSH